jgi:pimeloyl-ACP methyl ester carboxylesterase
VCDANPCSTRHGLRGMAVVISSPLDPSVDGGPHGAALRLPVDADRIPFVGEWNTARLIEDSVTFASDGRRRRLERLTRAKEYFDEVRAPHKQFVLIRNCGHLAAFSRPEQFLDELVQHVRPLAGD